MDLDPPKRIIAIFLHWCPNGAYEKKTGDDSGGCVRRSVAATMHEDCDVGGSPHLGSAKTPNTNMLLRHARPITCSAVQLLSSARFNFRIVFASRVLRQAIGVFEDTATPCVSKLLDQRTLRTRTNTMSTPVNFATSPMSTCFGAQVLLALPRRGGPAPTQVLGRGRHMGGYK